MPGVLPPSVLPVLMTPSRTLSWVDAAEDVMSFHRPVVESFQCYRASMVAYAEMLLAVMLARMAHECDWWDVLQLRERDWANVITAHEGDPSAYTWRLSHLTLGEHVLRPPSKKLKVWLYLFLAPVQK